jgi:hypothetical protein
MHLALGMLFQKADSRTSKGRPMKKTLKSVPQHYSLGDLILAVSSYSKNNRETVAAVADLLESGKVRFTSNGRKIRARVF